MKTETKTETTTKGAQHTPGPWTASRDDWEDYTGHRIEGDDKCVAITCTVDAVEVTPEDAANARLIAAAPELLDALRAYVAELEEQCLALGWASVAEYRKHHNDRESYALARAAIAKATGQE